MTTPPGDQPPYDPNQPPPGQVPPPPPGGQVPPPPPGGGGYTTPPPTGGYGDQPGGYPPPGPPASGGSTTNVLGITSLVLGILSIVMFFCCLGVILGPAAIVTGFLGMRKADEPGSQVGGRGMAMAGLICGAIGLVIALFFIILAAATGDWNYNYDFNS